ncbi:hypothetical protein [Clostridium thermosuccinogenes]|uniref:hypothetical protein n=1 Tax=Clostridium thermosuccinogenes TaxID=84032 RepID=UPI001057265D|nr:hypothetical protein [Pseudoclostridium thermosuccinogenes]
MNKCLSGTFPVCPEKESQIAGTPGPSAGITPVLTEGSIPFMDWMKVRCERRILMQWKVLVTLLAITHTEG